MKSIVREPTYGYFRLDPIPTSSELSEFYEECYYELVRKGERAPGIRRAMAGGDEGEHERSWLRSSLYADILAALEENGAPGPKRLLDLGCGTGELGAFMKEKGWEVVGIEPSHEAAEIASSRGLQVSRLTMDEFIDRNPNHHSHFGAVTMVNVLEHVPNPVRVLRSARTLLCAGGAAVVVVPNDFNPLQLAARDVLQKGEWWVSVPDHINYFSHESLGAVLADCGYHVVQSQATFPMEMFLLMGDDYVGNPDIGRACHEKRVRFETSLPGEARRRLYRSLAQAGLGRQCIAVGRRVAE